MKPLFVRLNFAALLAALTLSTQGTAFAEYTISTLASSTTNSYEIDGKGVAVDTAGRVYATGSRWSQGWNLPAILALTGTVRPIVGGTYGAPYPGCGEPASNVGFTNLSGVAVDSSGAFYISQTGGYGPIVKVQGTAICLPSPSALLESHSIAIDDAGNAYFSAALPSHLGRVVYKLTAAGALVPFAGNASVTACTGGALGQPEGVAVDRSGNLYVADYKCNVIWKVSSPGATPVRVAGNGIPGFSGDGPATAVSLCQPSGVAVDYDGNLFITDSCNQRVREVSASTHNMTTIAGTGVSGSSGDGGPATSAELEAPRGIAVGSDGRIYIGDQLTSGVPIQIRELTPPSARIISPAPGSILPSSSVTFDWAGTSTATHFILSISDSTHLIYTTGDTTAIAETVHNLPCDGRRLNVELQTKIGTQWLSARYTYNACPLSMIVRPSPQAGNLSIIVNATNIWPENVVLKLTESLYPTLCRTTIHGLYCPPPAPVGAPVQIQPGSSQSVPYSVPTGPTHPYRETFVFTATLTTVSGTMLFSSQVDWYQ